MKNDISIIIQGPLHEHSISNIDTYKKYGSVIFVAWAKDFVNSIELISQIKKSNAFLLLLPDPIFNENRQNIAYQANSTLDGIKICDSEYIIKLRSDEKYSNLDNLITKMINSDKIITSNIFFRKYHNYPWHISDHIIAGKKDILFSIFNQCCIYCRNKKQWIQQYNHIDVKIINIPRFNLVPEQIITLSSIPVLSKTNETLDWTNKNHCIEYMKNNFDIINISKLSPFIVSYSYQSVRYYQNNINKILNYHTDIIESMDEYI